MIYPSAASLFNLCSICMVNSPVILVLLPCVWTEQSIWELKQYIKIEHPDQKQDILFSVTSADIQWLDERNSLPLNSAISELLLSSVVRFMGLFSWVFFWVVRKWRTQRLSRYEFPRFSSVLALLNYFWPKASVVEVNVVIPISDFYTYYF